MYIKTIISIGIALTSLSAFSQQSSYDEAEIAALKAFFNLPSEDNSLTNGQTLGISDIESWNPAVEPAGIVWNDESQKSVTALTWDGKKLAGSLDLSIFDCLESLECNENAISAITFPETMDRLTRVFVRDNHLESLILPETASALFSVNCQNNNIRQLSIPGSVTTAFINYNQLTFSSLPEKISEEWAYAPQDTIRIDTEGLQVDLSKEYDIRGNISTFTWFSLSGSNEKIPIDENSYQADGGKFTFTSQQRAGHLFCEINNPAYPGLTLQVSVAPAVPQYNEAEIATLRAFLALPSHEEGQTNGNVLGYNGDAAIWSPEMGLKGVTWENGRVTYINWVLQPIAGILDLSEFSTLERIETSKTYLTGLILPENAPELTVIYCQESELESLKLPVNAPKLSMICCSSNELTSLQLPESVADGLELDAQRNHIRTADIPEACAKRMYTIWFHYNELEELHLPDDISRCRYLYLRSNRLTHFNMPSVHPALERFWIEDNAMRFSTLPVDEIPVLYAYAPQDTFTVNANGRTVDLSAETTVKRSGNETTTVFSWFVVKTDGQVESLDSELYQEQDGVFTFNDGIDLSQLQCRMTNSAFPDLTLVCNVTDNAGISSMSDRPTLHVYPNPATDILHVNLPLDADTCDRICIFSLDGRLVKELVQWPCHTPIFLRGIVPGIYIVSIRHGNTNDTARLVIKSE